MEARPIKYDLVDFNVQNSNQEPVQAVSKVQFLGIAAFTFAATLFASTLWNGAIDSSAFVNPAFQGRPTSNMQIKSASDAPKRPMNPYMRFSNAMRPELMKKNPEARMGDISKILGEQWAKLSDKDKAQYVTAAAKDKERYAKEMEGYVAPPRLMRVLRVSKEDKAASTPKKETSPIKRPLTSYMLFSKEMRPKVKEGRTSVAVVEELARLWNELPAKQKEKYVAKYKVLKAAYDEEIAAWKSQQEE